MKKTIYFSLLALMAVFLSSCATVTHKPALKPSLASESFPIEKIPLEIARNNAIHTVAPGETLLRVSKMYDVPAEDIARKNNLGSSSQLKEGQRLVIPNAAPIKPIISLYTSRKWKYIIIHHSATDDGDSLDFNKLHKRKGWKGVGYDFVIDNGTRGKQDGQIETSPRWIKQQDGAHCNASGMNFKGIGICLVGNFSKEKVSEKQMESLVYLVNILRKHYKISEDYIMGHGQVRGAKTECPGKYFPWDEFRKKLKNDDRGL
ncbi:MAG: N-acetylmuramoyl-L-alanine amidase [Nitrospirae bacterium]|nr:N-acetylmuramoyl-L-alanine amidase [Nitrospirota bacterium]